MRFALAEGGVKLGTEVPKVENIFGHKLAAGRTISLVLTALLTKSKSTSLVDNYSLLPYGNHGL
jgi:hypothetical protein